MSESPSTHLDLLADVLKRAKAAGADAADAVYVKHVSLALSQRLGEPEHLNRSEGNDLGLRVFCGKRQAIVSSSDTSPAALAELAERTVAMARAVPEDPYCGLADPELLAGKVPDLDMCDPSEPTGEKLISWASTAEDAARAVKGVTNSEGAEAHWSRSQVALAATNGFARAYAGSRWGLSVSVVAGEGTNMERDYDFTGAVHAEDLRKPEEVGRTAGEKAVRRLGPKRVPSMKVPVVFDPRVSRSIIGHLAGAITGPSVARGTTFLKDKLGKQIFRDGVTIVDDPLRRRGLASKPFDAEGVATKRRNIIDKGTLTTWVLDLRSARQLGLQTTGHASRGTSSPPSPGVTNFYLEAGKLTPEALMADIKSGLYVTGLIGFGINGITGDYSRGAEGFWIENGKLSHPVNELTIAGNLKDMFLEMTAANDLTFRYGMDAPTIRIDGMTAAGK
jgi:PmbA protein